MILDGLESMPFGVYEFDLVAQETTRLPSNLGSVLRGGFGLTFKEMACAYDDRPPCPPCSLQDRCAYARIFETPLPSGSDVLKAAQNVPAPYVIRAPRWSQDVWRPGDELRFELVLVGWSVQALPLFMLTFQRLGEKGLGRERGRFFLWQVLQQKIESGDTLLIMREGRVRSDLLELIENVGALNGAGAYPVNGALSLRLLTPTRLKYNQQILNTPPPFHVVVRTLMRRVSSLSYFYGGRRWQTDYRGWIEKAKAVKLVDADTRWQEWSRYSTRQRQKMKLGGLVGEVRYEGDVAPFAPLLRLGELIHVGKNTVFGHGRYELIV